MSEDVARAVGASVPGEVTIAGKKCRLRPLSIRELTEVQREGVRIYRKNYLNQLRDTVEFYPEGKDEFRQAIEKSAHWEADDLPKKEVYDSTTLQHSPALSAWLVENIPGSESKVHNLLTFQRMVASALDGGVLTEDVFKELTGHFPSKMKTGYINWWVTGTVEGMMCMIWQSVKHSGVSREDVDSLLSDPSVMMLFAREIEAISVPAAGNG